jgi:predicted metal-dependent phosphoesterase TrpH
MYGAVEFARIVPIRIIVGQEISTGQGDIIGLFLKDQISSGQGLEETIKQIKGQKGLVYLPHPFDEFRKSSVKMNEAETFKRKIDIIEVFNSRTFNSRCDELALDFAKKNDIITAVSSDAHHHWELANAYMKMDDFDGPGSFLESLRNAKYFARKCPFILRLYIKGLKLITGKE